MVDVVETVECPNAPDNVTISKLPQTYIDCLEFSNGSVLRGTVAEIYGLDKIIVKSEYFPDGHIIIGSLTGDGELICFLRKQVKFLLMIIMI